MKKLHKNIIISVLLALILTLCSTFPVYAENIQERNDGSFENPAGLSLLPTTYATVGFYEDKYFTDMSEPDPVHLHVAAQYISLCAECMDDTDSTTLICCIESIEPSYPFSYTLSFTADGSVTTYPISIPSGRYRVYFVGTEDDKEIYVADAVFSAFITP